MRQRNTILTIEGDRFRINGTLTYPGRSWEGIRVEGLLMNTRMVQGVFDDRNPETRERWAYPDTGVWDPDRNVREFLEAMPSWAAHGVTAFTLNLQGGSPEGYSSGQPWDTSAFFPDGSVDPAYLVRLEKILDRADELGMVVILGYFYFGQAHRLQDEAAVIRAAEEVTQWVLDRGYRNVLIEIDNECDINSVIPETSPYGYRHPILDAGRVHELIRLVQEMSRGGVRLPVGTSCIGGSLPGDEIVTASDILLLHGNAVNDPARITEMVRELRQRDTYRGQPILFNEDDHFDFDSADNHLLRALREGASWGYFDPGSSNYRDGYQCPPVNWRINTDLKRSFFRKVRDLTGATGQVAPRS